MSSEPDDLIQESSTDGNGPLDMSTLLLRASIDLDSAIEEEWRERNTPELTSHSHTTVLL